MEYFDVLIVGAGPTGLIAAIECARRGLSCCIIDKRLQDYFDVSRAVIIQPRTLEMLSHIGVIEPFLQQGIAIHGATPHFHGKPLAHLSFSSLHSPYPFVLSIQQTKTEKILEDHASFLGTQIHKGSECIHIEEMPLSVVATIEDVLTKQTKLCKATYLIGCDGAHSYVRKSLDLSFKGKTFPDIFSFADLRIEWEYPHDEVTPFLGKTEVLIAIPLPRPFHYRLIFKPKSSSELPSLAEITAMLQPHTGAKARVLELEQVAHFHVNSRHVDSYQKGRVFLAGDAAHIHSPLGGQGMNTGMQDTFNLIWKLALVIQKNTSSSLISTYHTERHTVAKTLLSATTRATYLATLSHPISIWLRNRYLSCLKYFPRVQLRLACAISQISLSYPKSFLCIGKMAGKRAPMASVFYKGEKTNLYDLWKASTGFTTLIFCHTHPVNSIKEKQKRLFPCPVFYICLLPCAENHQLTCHDAHGMAHKAYLARSVTICIIRPDGYIGWYGTNHASAIAYLQKWS